MSEDKILRQIHQRIKENIKDGQLLHLELDTIPIRTISKSVKELIESRPSIEYLTLNDCELISLKNFPKLPNLTVLELSNNKIYDDDLFHLLVNTEITHLMLDDNQLKSIEKVSVLRHFVHLEQLEIQNNLMGETDFYRQELFDKIPNLKILDCSDKFGNIAIDSDSEEEEEEMKRCGSEEEAEERVGCGWDEESRDLGEKGEKELLNLLEGDQGSDEGKQDEQNENEQNDEKETHERGTSSSLGGENMKEEKDEGRKRVKVNEVNDESEQERQREKMCFSIDFERGSNSEQLEEGQRYK